MDAFVRKLVERLLDESHPLTRNRHFATLETPEGKKALRVSRRLKALRLGILAAQRAGGASTAVVRQDAAGEVRIELRFEQLGARRMTLLEEDEFAILERLPGVAGVLQAE